MRVFTGCWAVLCGLCLTVRNSALMQRPAPLPWRLALVWAFKPCNTCCAGFCMHPTLEAAGVPVALAGAEHVRFVPSPMLGWGCVSKPPHDPDRLGARPDIVHCHDWATAPVAFGDPQAAPVFTIHNLNYGADLIGRAVAASAVATTVSPTYAAEARALGL